MEIDEGLRIVAHAASERVPELAAAIRERTQQDAPEYFASGDPALDEHGDRSIAAALRDIFGGLARGRHVPDGAPDEALEEARVAAQADVDLHVLLRTYRIGQVLSWNILMEEAEARIEDPSVRIAVLQLASDFQFAWNDRATAAVVDVYQKERDNLFRSRERRKRELIRDLLNGLPVDASRLGYDLGRDHVSAIAWGMAPDQALNQLAGSVDGVLMTVTGTAGTILGWVGRHGLAQLQPQPGSGFQPPGGTHVAIGEAASGADGFRASHRQALQAYRVARFDRRAVAMYRDVVLEALVIRDLQAVRDFVAHELHAISGDDPRGDILRATLRAYFSTGLNAASAAHLLGVHERTVTYRLRSIEARLGITVASRRDELALALRLADLLDAPEGPPDLERLPDSLLDARGV